MKTTSQKGSSKLGVLFALLLIISIALNVMFISGHDIFKLSGVTKTTGMTPASVPSAEATYLREIAGTLKIGETPEKTSGDIAFDIQQRLSKSMTYKGTVLSPEAFAKACSAIRIAEDQEVFKSYHEFVGKVVGKKLIILE